MIRLLQHIARVAWLLALALGSILWFSPGLTGNVAVNLQIHMALGAVVALVLAVVAVSALINRVRIPIASIGLLWAVALVCVGAVRMLWLGEGSHAGIALIHVVLGVGAIGLAEVLAGAIRRASLAA
jgi:hypothetical protein